MYEASENISGFQTSPSVCELLVGTSGYSYAEWAEAGFYPPGTQPGRMLPIYSRVFSVTELNYTWYQTPKPQALERMARQVPRQFFFTAKLTRSLTHEVDADQWRSDVAKYRDGISALIQSGRLIAVLIQLPPSFERISKNRQYLAALLDELEGIPLAVEFRHRSWAHDRVFAELERRKVTLVTVDAPPLPGLFPCLDAITNPNLFYIRFHGRNTRGWRSGNMQKQFDYNYTDQELCEWAGKHIEKMAKNAHRGVMFFNNHVRGQAADNARVLMEKLVERGLMENRPSPGAQKEWTEPLFT